MKVLFYPFLFLILIGCISSSNLNTENSNEKRYAFGKGGGFTGDYTEFILNENGKVYKYDYKYDREVFYKNLAKVDLDYFLTKIDDLGLDGIDINEPGNLSYYIDLRIGQNSINKIVWGARQYYAPKELITFHDEAFKKLAEFE